MDALAGAHLRRVVRIFFPTGAALGIVGVSLWVLYYLGAGVSYPNVTHARVMIEGLMASFNRPTKWRGGTAI